MKENACRTLKTVKLHRWLLLPRISPITSHYRDCDVKYEYNNGTSTTPPPSCSVCISASSCVLTLNAVRRVRQPEAQQPSDATQASCHADALPSPPAPAAGLTGRPPIPCIAQSLKIHQRPRRHSHCSHWDQTTLFCSPMHTVWPCVCSARRNWSSTLFLSSVLNLSDKDESRWSLKVTCWETSAAAQTWTLPLCQVFSCKTDFLWILHKYINSIYSWYLFYNTNFWCPPLLFSANVAS